MAHPDLNALKDALLPIARQMLTEHGEFYPSGVVMTPDGRIARCLAAESGQRRRPSELLELFSLEFQKLASAREIRAAGLCCNVRVATQDHPEKIDAVQFALEHQNGEAVDVFLPYDLDAGAEVRFGRIFASRRNKAFFLQ